MKKNVLSTVLLSLLLIASAPAFAETFNDYIAGGNTSAQEKKYEEAIKNYQKALTLNPKSAKANLLLGLCHAQLGHMDEALSYVRAASQLEPSYLNLYNLGLIYAAQEKPQEALQAFDRAETISPESGSLAYQKGLAYATLKNDDEAIRHYKQALKLNPYLDNARISLAGILSRQGDRNGAHEQIETFRKMKKEGIADALEAKLNSGTL